MGQYFVFWIKKNLYFLIIIYFYKVDFQDLATLEPVLKDFCDHADVEYNYVCACARLQQNQVVINTAFN